MQRRSRQVPRSKSLDRKNPHGIPKKGGKSRGNVYAGKACSCAAGFTADCAAICCCPCALLHLLFLTFVKLPATLATKAFCHAKKSALDNVNNSSCSPAEPRRLTTPPWSCRESPEPSGGRMPPFEGPKGANIDSEKVWAEMYAAGHMGFGGLPTSLPGD